MNLKDFVRPHASDYVSYVPAKELYVESFETDLYKKDMLENYTDETNNSDQDSKIPSKNEISDFKYSCEDNESESNYQEGLFMML